MLSCSTKNCHANKTLGDEHFCVECREEWMKYSEKEMLTELTPEDRVLMLMDVFKNRLEVKENG